MAGPTGVRNASVTSDTAPNWKNLAKWLHLYRRGACAGIGPSKSDDTQDKSINCRLVRGSLRDGQAGSKPLAKIYATHACGLQPRLGQRLISIDTQLPHLAHNVGCICPWCLDGIEYSNYSAIERHYSMTLLYGGLQECFWVNDWADMRLRDKQEGLTFG
jgi:hypothetical protein